MLLSKTQNRRGRFVWLRLVSIALVTLAVARGATLTKGPYLQAPAHDGMTIVWETLTEEPGMLQFGEGASLSKTIGPITPRRVESGMTQPDAKQTFFVYSARLTGLKANQTYTYEAAVGADRSGRRQFKTFGAAPDRVTFIAYGDSRTNPDKHAAIAAQFPKYSPEFILHTGDLVARGAQYDLWSPQYFEPLRNVIDRTPLLAAIGNHEGDGVNYQVYFQAPGTRDCFYSFDVGPVHVLSLDYRSTKATDDQFRFVEADLKASRAPWKLVLLHDPVFNLGGHGTLWSHDVYLPLFRATQVDLVVAGHSHLYERFRPLAPKGQPDAWAIQHITTGGGGAPLSAAVPDPSLAQALSVCHFLVFDATRDRLTGRCIDIEGAERDTFTFRKTGGRRQLPAAVYAEEDVVAKNKTLPKKSEKKKKTETAATP